MPELLDTPLTAAPPEPSVLLAQNLSAIRRRETSVAVGTGMAKFLGALILIGGVGMFLDWWLDLPWGVRLVWLIAAMAVLGWLAWRFILHPLLHPPDDDLVALKIEKAKPIFRTRLISAVQLTRPGALEPGASAGLVSALVAETEGISRRVELDDVVSTRDLRKFGGWAIAAVAVGLFLFLSGGQTTIDLLKRALLSHIPVPRKTRVEVLTANTRIGRGDALKIEARAHGILPAAGRLELKSSGLRTQKFPMERQKTNQSLYTRVIQSVPVSFDYVVFLNDGQSERFHVDVVPRPSVVKIECLQTYPKYTGLTPVKRGLADLDLLAGSTLDLDVIASADLTDAALNLVGLSNSVPMSVDAANRRHLGRLQVPAKGLVGFAVDMTDTTGMTSKDGAIYRINLIPDRAPTVKIIQPSRKEELATRRAIVDLGIEGKDDFGIAKLRLRYRVEETNQVKSIELDLATNAVTTLKNRVEWKLAEVVPPVIEGGRIEYWIEAEDNNDVTGPGLGSSDHQLIRIVSEDEKRADLMNRASDFLNTIGDVAGDQDKLNQNLGRLLLPKRQ